MDEKPGDKQGKTDDSLFGLISSETIFMGPGAIPSLICTRMAYQEYGLVLANIVNEPGLAWLHHRLGVIGG